MAKYKVIVIAVLLANGRTAQANDLVEDKQLATDAEKLVEGGYIQKATASEIKEWNDKNDPETDRLAKEKADAEAKAGKK